MIHVDICVCTFRRESLSDTLASLAALDLPDGVSCGVIVADNDTGPSARDRVAAFAGRAPVPVTYVHCPAGNISVARNAALAATDAQLVAFIDDDEVAMPGWLAALLQERARSGADVVLGPVEARYGDAAPGWMRAAGVHATRPVRVGGEIRTGYTCNVLIDRGKAAIRALRFNPVLGRSGGEDTDYFSALHRAGGTFAYAPGAVVEEPVEPGRLSFRWLARRRFRMGQTHATSVLMRSGRGRWAMLPVAAAKVLYCGLLALATLPNARARNAAILRGCLHVGVIAGLAGGAAPELYGVAAAEASE